VPVHPKQEVDLEIPASVQPEIQAGSLLDQMSELSDEEEIFRLVLEQGSSGDELLALAESRPSLVARLLARSMDRLREAGGAVPVERADGEPHKARILVAEDDTDCNATVSWFLRQKGYEVMQAHNGIEAMQLFNEQIPDLVLCDVYMPRMNGFKVLMEIKNAAPDLPVLLMTGSTSVSQVFETFRYNKVGFISKPFRLGELGKRVHSFLGVVND
jgi:CheY-like chemotaxis protein